METEKIVVRVRVLESNLYFSFNREHCARRGGNGGVGSAKIGKEWVWRVVC
jgi:hypothetical protein